MLKTYLESISKFTDQNLEDDRKFKCFEALVLEYGKPMPSTVRRPKEFRKMAYKECYANSLHLIFENDKLTYCEGYAQHIIPVAHAWVLDENGNVIDVTWKADEVQETEYYGIPFAKPWLMEWIWKTGYYGILGNGDYSQLHELLKNGLPENAILK
jgi:hypothetical protein